MNPIGLIYLAAGLFCICGAVLDWNWFMNSRKAAFLVKIFGRNGARIFYSLLGGAIALAGILVTAGAFQAT